MKIILFMQDWEDAKYNANDLDSLVLILYKNISSDLSICWSMLFNDIKKYRVAKRRDGEVYEFKSQLRKKYESQGFDCFNCFERKGIEFTILEILQTEKNHANDIYEKISCIFKQNESQKIFEEIITTLMPNYELRGGTKKKKCKTK
jgi:hypothetical protein